MDHQGRVRGALSGGVTVAATGLPGVIALGALAATPLGSHALASGVAAAFVAAVAGGLCAAAIARTPGAVSGPDTSLSIVYASLCTDLMLRGGSQLAVGEIIAALSLAVMLMGVLQLLAGWARLGEALKFLPYPVTAGILTGTGLLVIWAQLGPLIGLEGSLTRYDWVGLLRSFKPLALAIGVASALAVWLAPKRLQPLLAGLAAGIVLHYVIAQFAGRDAAGPTLEAMSAASAVHERAAGFWGRVGPGWLVDTSLQVLPYAALLALEGMMELAHTSHTLGEITGVRPDIHRGLIAQGWANILCGALAALPVAPSHSQSTAAARSRGARSMVPAVSAMVLLVAAVAMGGLLDFVPAAVLAGLLVAVGLGLIDRWTRGLVGRAARGSDVQAEIKWNLAIVAVVAAALFFGGVPVALLVGTVLAMVLLAHSLSAATSFLSEEGTGFASTRIWPAEQAAWLVSARGVIRVLRPRGGLFFGTAEQLAHQLAALDAAVRYCAIDCSRLTVVDATGCQIVAAGARRLAERGVVTVLAGLDPENEHDRGLVALGLDDPYRDRWFADLDHALEWVEAELLRERWPEIASDGAVEIGATQLAKGLPRAELEVLQSHLGATEVEAGRVLFERGAAGDALYVISRGLIEIRVGSDARAAPTRRLAVFGPGCIFGESAMLMRGPRTADAVCVKPARLYELRRDALLELEGLFPVIHAKLIANLNLHLATRLAATTEIARGR